MCRTRAAGPRAPLSFGAMFPRYSCPLRRWATRRAPAHSRRTMPQSRSTRTRQDSPATWPPKSPGGARWSGRSISRARSSGSTSHKPDLRWLNVACRQAATGPAGRGRNALNFSLPFIERPIATILLSVGLFLAGAVAYRFMPVAALPNVEFPTIYVLASRAGGDPSTMAGTVAGRRERRLGEIPGVIELTSTSTVGASSISILFDLGRKIDSAARDVQAALNAAVADLPGDLPSLPTFRKANPNGAPILILALTSDTLAPSAIYDVADTVLAQRISQLDGVAEATVNGAEQPAIRVRVNPVAIASMGLSMEDVRLAIINANAAGPLGVFDSDGIAQTIATNGQMRDPREYRDIVVKSQNGAVTLLGDIATVEQSTRNSRAAAWFNGQPAILINITKQADANVIETVDRIYAMLPELKRWVPAGIRFSVLTDRTLMIRASVRDMQLTLGATIVLVMLVVFVFLRRSPPTVAVGITEPCSLSRP